MLKNLFYLCVMMALSALILTNCSEDTANFIPEIFSPVYPDTLYRNTGAFYIEISAMDPQGLQDIAAVEYRLEHPGTGEMSQWSSLFDTGSGGDEAAGDGRYSKLVTGFDHSDSTGQYIIRFVAYDTDNHQSNEIEVTFNVSANNVPRVSDPKILDAYYEETDTVYQDLLDSIYVTVDVEEPDGYGEIANVWFEIYRPDGSSNDYDYFMFDDGITNGDTTEADGIFTTKISSAELDVYSGNFALKFKAEDIRGAASQTVTKYVFVGVLNNEPPVLANVTGPDTLSASSDDTSIFTVEVSDPQGAADVDSVWFQSYRPDGSSNENQFYLNDDGEYGDETAGDGVYTIGITSYGADPLGQWRFEFWAKDIHGALSDSLDKYIQIVE